MAKVKVKYLNDFLVRIRETINKFPPEFYKKDVGEYVVERIKLKARTGSTMVSGVSEKLKPLSKPYIKQRKRRVRLGHRLGEFFSPKRSNLTLTGQYLPSIKVTEVNLFEHKLVIEPTGTREDRKLTNKKLASYLAKGGRNIFGLDVTGRKVIKQKVLREFRRQLKQKLVR